jgi:ABC-type sugar transport system permease subunit
MRILDRLPLVGARDRSSAAIDARRANLGILVAFLAPALLVYAGFTIYPVIRTFYNAFHTIKPQGVVEFVGLANFQTLLLADSTFWKAVANTAWFAIVATIVDVIGGCCSRSACLPGRRSRHCCAWCGSRPC